MPVKTSRALLIIFFSMPIIVVSIYYLIQPFTLPAPEIFSLVLLYTSCSLVYISLYSAIEQRSPTLSILSQINSFGEIGCEENQIIEKLKPADEIEKRIAVMTDVGWLLNRESHYFLTSKGSRIARIFNMGALIMGIGKGG